MQNNQITVGTTQYDRFKETPDKTTYISTDHTVGSVDMLLLARTVPTSDSSNAKSRASFVRDIERGDADKTTGRIYCNVDFSFPQWATDDDVQGVIDAADAFLSSTEFNTLVIKQSI